MTEFDPHERARESYAMAYERVQAARREWEAAGSPFTMTHRNQMVGQHPLWRALRQAEQDAAARLERVRVAHRGPRATAVIETDLGPSPAARLRVLKPPAG